MRRRRSTRSRETGVFWGKKVVPAPCSWFQAITKEKLVFFRTGTIVGKNTLLTTMVRDSSIGDEEDDNFSIFTRREAIGVDLVKNLETTVKLLNKSVLNYTSKYTRSRRYYTLVVNVNEIENIERNKMIKKINK